MIFDRITSMKYVGFGQYDFVQVEKTRRLELPHVVDSINKLSAQVNAIKSYHGSFKKLAPIDRLGSMLDELMPEFLKDANNLVHVRIIFDFNLN